MRDLVQQIIKALHDNDQCPRLMVDARVDGVVVPEHIREKWGQALPIDLDPRYPLELQMTDEGIACSLSFGGPHDCFFPWRSVYLVQDRDTQMGIVVEENVPTPVRHQKEHPGVAALKDETITVARVDKAHKVDQGPPAEPQPSLSLAEDTTLGETLAEPDLDTPEVRRARFRVIDGGRDD